MANFDIPRGKAFVLIDSEINLNNERKTKIIESIKYNRLEVCEHNDSKTFDEFLSKQLTSDIFLTNAPSYEMIGVFVISKKFPGPYEFRKYSKNDVYAIVANCAALQKKIILFVVIMEDHYENYTTDSLPDNHVNENNRMYKFEAICPVTKEGNHFEPLLDQFLVDLSSARDEENFIERLERIENDNTGCEINLMNPLQVPLYLGP
ncbi:uncharacterized protein LOC143914835 [Arctopsyche grandis]|uniref:uncharacterized protein LOC143914835 n=1 Tax=Arctopsyche grandis TaxID=121162 RepID=UPI00406D8852